MIIAVINNKGGTGKTITTVNLGAALAEAGYGVLVVDLDPQASATLALGSVPSASSPSVADVLFGKRAIQSAIHSTRTPGLHLLPAHKALYMADVNIEPTADRQGILKNALTAVWEVYDFILLDCPPFFSTLSINALVAADTYIVPVTPDYLTLEDLTCLSEMMEQMREDVGVSAQLLGILVTMTPTLPAFFSARSRLARSNVSQLRDYFGEKVFLTEIKSDARLADSPAYGKTVFGTAPSSRPAKQFEALADEVLKRCRYIRRKAARKHLGGLARMKQLSIDPTPKQGSPNTSVTPPYRSIIPSGLQVHAPRQVSERRQHGEPEY